MNENNKKIEGIKIIMTFGTFDYLHAGHENYLKQAKELGNHLIVIIARDETVKNIKGEYPLYNEKERLKAIKNLKIADKVILGNHRDKHKVILKYRPQVIALGYDQFVFTQKLEKTLIDAQINAEIIRLQPFFPQIYKSSLLKKQQTSVQNLKFATINES